MKTWGRAGAQFTLTAARLLYLCGFLVLPILRSNYQDFIGLAANGFHAIDVKRFTPFCDSPCDLIKNHADKASSGQSKRFLLPLLCRQNPVTGIIAIDRIIARFECLIRKGVQIQITVRHNLSSRQWPSL